MYFQRTSPFVLLLLQIHGLNVKYYGIVLFLSGLALSVFLSTPAILVPLLFGLLLLTSKAFNLVTLRSGRGVVYPGRKLILSWYKVTSLLTVCMFGALLPVTLLACLLGHAPLSSLIAMIVFLGIFFLSVTLLSWIRLGGLPALLLCYLPLVVSLETLHHLLDAQGVCTLVILLLYGLHRGSRRASLRPQPELYARLTLLALTALCASAPHPVSLSVWAVVAYDVVDYPLRFSYQNYPSQHGRWDGGIIFSPTWPAAFLWAVSATAVLYYSAGLADSRYLDVGAVSFLCLLALLLAVSTKEIAEVLVLGVVAFFILAAGNILITGAPILLGCLLLCDFVHYFRTAHRPKELLQRSYISARAHTRTKALSRGMLRRLASQPLIHSLLTPELQFAAVISATALLMFCLSRDYSSAVILVAFLPLWTGVAAASCRHNTYAAVKFSRALNSRSVILTVAFIVGCNTFTLTLPLTLYFTPSVVPFWYAAVVGCLSNYLYIAMLYRHDEIEIIKADQETKGGFLFLMLLVLSCSITVLCLSVPSHGTRLLPAFTCLLFWLSLATTVHFYVSSACGDLIIRSSVCIGFFCWIAHFPDTLLAQDVGAFSAESVLTEETLVSIVLLGTLLMDLIKIPRLKPSMYSSVWSWLCFSEGWPKSLLWASIVILTSCSLGFRGCAAFTLVVTICALTPISMGAFFPSISYLQLWVMVFVFLFGFLQLGRVLGDESSSTGLAALLVCFCVGLVIVIRRHCHTVSKISNIYKIDHRRQHVWGR